MDDARLRADYENLQKLINRIPPEILELAKRGQLNHSIVNDKIIFKWTDTKTVHFLYDSYRKI